MITLNDNNKKSIHLILCEDTPLKEELVNQIIDERK
jgi:hypothetical protein